VQPYQVIATSLEVVSGKPAIAYYDYNYRQSGAKDDLKYVSATDPFGYDWGAPVTIDSIGITGGFPSLQVVNGLPAISYYDYTNSDLKYVLAAKHSTGKNKNALIEVYPNPVTGDYVNVLFTDLPQGNYTIRLVNLLGQTIFTKQIRLFEDIYTETIQLIKASKQVYHLEIIKPDKSKYVNKLVAY
jgi:hypothetical protein